MRWMIGSDQSLQYEAGQRPCWYKVLPLRRVFPPGSGVKQELALLRDEEAVQVRRVDLEERVPFLHRSGVARHGEPKQPGLVPDLDRLDERSGGELAVPDGAHAGPLDPGANGVGHARAEEPVVRRVEVGEADDIPPDVLGRGVDHHRGLAGEEQGLGRREMFGAHHRRQEGEQDEHDLAKIAGAPWPQATMKYPTIAPSITTGTASGSIMTMQINPSNAVATSRTSAARIQSKPIVRHCPSVTSLAGAVNHDREHRQHERKADEQAPAVVVEDVRAEVNHRRGDRQGDQRSPRSPSGMRTRGRASIDFEFAAPGTSIDVVEPAMNPRLDRLGTRHSTTKKTRLIGMGAKKNATSQSGQPASRSRRTVSTTPTTTNGKASASIVA